MAVSGLVTSPLTHTEPSQGLLFSLRQGHFIVQAGLDIDTEPKGNLGSSSYASASQVLGLDYHTHFYLVPGSNPGAFCLNARQASSLPHALYPLLALSLLVTSHLTILTG